MTSPVVTTATEGRVRLLGLNRPEKRNAFSLAMIRALSAGLEAADADPNVLATVLFAHGTVFTAGLDLVDVLPHLARGKMIDDGQIDPWATHGRERAKPLVTAVHGKCLTLGIELMLAGDIAVAAADATFAQVEISRGIFPFGGGTARWVQTAGWGNAMRYLLTGDELNAEEAHRIGLVQHVVPTEQLLETAKAIAARIATQAPLGVRATIDSARTALREGERASAQRLLPELLRLAQTSDAREGLAAFLERRAARFTGL